MLQLRVQSKASKASKNWASPIASAASALEQNWQECQAQDCGHNTDHAWSCNDSQMHCMYVALHVTAVNISQIRLDSTVEISPKCSPVYTSNACPKHSSRNIMEPTWSCYFTLDLRDTRVKSNFELSCLLEKPNLCANTVFFCPWPSHSVAKLFCFAVFAILSRKESAFQSAAQLLWCLL